MRTFWLHLLNILINLYDLQYSNFSCFNFSASSLLSLLNIHAHIRPRYFKEFVYEIDKWLICNDGTANLYNLGVNATQFEFVASEFKSISTLYS